MRGKSVRTLPKPLGGRLEMGEGKVRYIKELHRQWKGRLVGRGLE
jgi:hypothetical protein